MGDERHDRWSRRQFLNAAALAGTGAALGLRSGPSAAEPPPETTRIRLIEISGVCIAPQYVAKDLLHDEGFTGVSYVGIPSSGIEATRALAAGKGDITISFVAPL